MLLAGLLEVVAVDHEIGAEAHRRVLDRIAVRHDDRRGDAVARRGERDRLAVVARVALITPRVRGALQQPVQVDCAAAA